MGKLVVALAIVAIAGMSQAAAFKWSTGALTAPNADGSAGTTVAADAMGTWLATITLYSDESCTTPITGVTGNSSSTVNSMGSNISGTFSGTTFAFDNSTMYYAVLDLSYTTDAGTQTLKTDTVSTKLKATGNTTLNFSTAIASATWSAAPEPTSGLLMLLGMAGLVLKRKSA